jgi:small ligand-binding sensory domain FIST
VAFTHEVGLVSRVTQGCAPVGPTRRITRSERNLVLELDGRPALDCLVEDLALDLGQPRQAMGKLRTTLAGIADASHDMLARRGQFGTDTRVRHVLGLDPTRRGVAIADMVEPGQQLAFCQRDTEAARRDLMRICSEIREELSPADDDSGALLDLASATLPDWSATLRGLGAARLLDGEAPSTPVATPGATPGGSRGDAKSFEQAAASAGKQAATGATTPADVSGKPGPAPQRPENQVAAAIYISCAGRGGPHFGAPSAELEIVRHALGDVPLIGFFAGGEIARHHLYGYTGVLTVLRTSA